MFKNRSNVIIGIIAAFMIMAPSAFAGNKPAPVTTDVNVIVISGDTAFKSANPVNPAAKAALTSAYPDGYSLNLSGNTEVGYAVTMATKFYREHTDGTAIECFLFLREKGINDWCIAVVKMSDGSDLCAFLPTYGGQYFLFQPIQVTSEKTVKGKKDKCMAYKNAKAASKTGKISGVTTMKAVASASSSDPTPVSGWNAGYNVQLSF